MTSQAQRTQPALRWQMPILPDHYDRSPLSPEEWLALEQYTTIRADSRRGQALQKQLTRFNQPLTDLYLLRYQSIQGQLRTDVHRFMQRQVLRLRKMYWEWDAPEWKEILCPTPAQFNVRHARLNMNSLRVLIMDAAYLLGEVSDLRDVKMGLHGIESAQIYFGAELVDEQWNRMLSVLAGRGYGESRGSSKRILQHLCMLFLLNRSPYLEDLTEELLIEVGTGSRAKQWSQRKITNGLYDLGLLAPQEEETDPLPTQFDPEAMAPEWFAWCMAWYERAVDFTLLVRQGYVHRILAVGRWLQERFPAIREPSQWTEELALCFRSDVCSWTSGQYSSSRGRQTLTTKGMLGQPMRSYGIAHYLTSMRRFLTDLTKRPYAVNGESARRISLDFVPKEVLTTPAPIRKALDAASPRDIDVQVWAKLAIAAATLSAQDLPRTTRYPLSFYRALALVWVTSARRPNEIARLRLDCLREEWAPDMLDEDGQPVEKVTLAGGPSHPLPHTPESRAVKLFYLQIPAGKNRGPFWIWIPDYVAAAINDWKRERPKYQRKLFDPKERENVDYLFCYQELRVGSGFINESLIPTLCARAGVSRVDATGKITGHRGRSTRLTLLRRRGVSLDDLAEYAGHTNTRTIRRYARQHPLQLHRIIRDADDVSRIIEGVVDVQAAVQGIPALRWFIGYDADGEPMYCGNQLYITCPHRLDCERCGMFIGGEKARLLHEGEHTLPITSKVPMTPIEQCVVSGDQEGEAACRAALQQVPAPQTPDIHLMFNPEGLRYEELKKLAVLGTPEALDKLRQALEAHEKRLEDMKQSKTGRNALVGAQRKRIGFIQDLLAASSQYRQVQEGS